MLFAVSSVPKGLSVRWLRTLEPLIVRRFQPTRTVSIAFVSRREMRRLNLLYRGKDAPTDVLSFRLSEGQGAPHRPIGRFESDAAEILVCKEELAQHAKERGTTLAAECRAMVLHAIVHTMGYDHETQQQARSMQAVERALARSLEKNLGKAAKFQYTKGIRNKTRTTRIWSSNHSKYA